MVGNGSGAPRAIIGCGLPLFAAAMEALLKQQQFDVVPPIADCATARAAVFDGCPQLAVLDFTDTSPSGLDMLRDARASGLPTRFILFCNEGDGDTPIDAVELGADGLLLRTASVDTVRQCLTSVAGHTQWLDPRAMRAAYDRMARRQGVVPALLTPRERDVALLVAAGQRNRVIAGELGISEGTVKMHLHNVYAKMGLESRTQLAMDARLRELA